MIFWTAFTLGLLGSFHCVGMCGPIALALPLGKNTGWGKRLLGGVLYNVGRILTYAVMGALFGLLGKGLVMAGIQQWLSIVVGVLMLVAVVFIYFVKKRWKATGTIFKGVGWIKQQLGHLFHKRSLSALFFIGLLNGLLPCGLVYLAVAGAIAEGTMHHGAFYMMLFGLGTLPAMLLLTQLGAFITVNMRNKIRKALPLAVVIIATLFILRGLNLGIPYISPEMSMEEPTVSNCCSTTTCTSQ